MFDSTATMPHASSSARFRRLTVIAVTALLGLGAVVAPSGAQASTNPSVLGLNETLTVGQSVHSPNGKYALVMQGDGNLVEYGPTGPNWSSATIGGAGSVAVMQGDGNFVVYDGRTPLWSTGTQDNSGSKLAIQDDGNIVVLTPANFPIWGLDVVQHGTQVSNPRMQQLISIDKSYGLVVQYDGNLVLYKGATAVWASNTSRPGVVSSPRLVMQEDGNLVMYNDTTPIWASNTYGLKQAHLVLQTDGNLVIYTPDGLPWWSSRFGREQRWFGGQ